MEIKYFDASGQPTTEAATRARYGQFQVYPAKSTGYTGAYIYRITEIRWCENGDSAMIATVKDPHAAPVNGALVAWGWPDAPYNQAAAPFGGMPGGLEPKSVDPGTTDANGVVAFAMGTGAYYHPENGETGPHASWIWGQSQTIACDVMEGIGMLGGTNHYHLRPTWTRYPTTEDPGGNGGDNGGEEPPVTDPLGRTFAVLDRNGAQQNYDWLAHYFGHQEQHHATNTEGYRAIAVKETGDLGSQTQTVKVELASGTPAAGVEVRYREVHSKQGETRVTDAGGFVSFPILKEHEYNVTGPDSKGPMFVQVGKDDALSDAVMYIGKVGNTDRHLDVAFRWGPKSSAPPTDPPDPIPPDPVPPTGELPIAGWDDLIDALNRIEAAIERING